MLVGQTGPGRGQRQVVWAPALLWLVENHPRRSRAGASRRGSARCGHAKTEPFRCCGIRGEGAPCGRQPGLVRRRMGVSQQSGAVALASNGSSLRATRPSNKGMKQTSVEHIGRSQLIPGVGRTVRAERAMARAQPKSRPKLRAAIPMDCYDGRDVDDSRTRADMACGSTASAAPVLFGVKRACLEGRWAPGQAGRSRSQASSLVGVAITSGSSQPSARRPCGPATLDEDESRLTSAEPWLRRSSSVRFPIRLWIDLLCDIVAIFLFARASYFVYRSSRTRGIARPPNKGMKQTSVERIGRSQLIPGVGHT